MTRLKHDYLFKNIQDKQDLNANVDRCYERHRHKIRGSMCFL
jgi:hypothetical protein